jgi:hypothetical protein
MFCGFRLRVQVRRLRGFRSTVRDGRFVVVGPSQPKRPESILGPGPPGFKIVCNYRICRARATRTGPQARHIHIPMAMTTIPEVLRLSMLAFNMKESIGPGGSTCQPQFSSRLPGAPGGLAMGTWEAADAGLPEPGRVPTHRPSRHRLPAAPARYGRARGRQIGAPSRLSPRACCRTRECRERSPRQPPPPASCCADESD